MNSHYEELIVVLDKEIEFHALLLATAKTMNEALRSSELTDIQKASRQYDECTCRIEELEEKRLNLSDIICGSDKKGAPHASLISVIDKAPAAYKNRIADLRAKLKNNVGDLSRINYSNQIFLQESLHTIAKTFEMIATREAGRLNGYKNRGVKDLSRTNKSIVNTIA
jgi:hypothetical protein